MEQRQSFFARALLRTVSWYSIRSPIIPGKGSLQKLALKAVGPVELVARTAEHGEYILRFPDDHGWEVLYFQGTFETGTTKLLKRLLRAEDVVFDIGANIGWFTVALARNAQKGWCHAFEPQPAVFGRLQRTCALNRIDRGLKLNQLALGDREGQVDLHSFGKLGSGHASISSLGQRDYSVVSVPLTTLDAYLTREKVDRIDLIKIDVEGAEMSVLKGASQVLALHPPPIWILEMNHETARAFGYSPQDLLEFLAQTGPYHFYRIIHGWGATVPMKSTADFEHADNVLCVPEARMERIQFLEGAEQS